ncbi:hypothetical protein J008_06369 [Cryptococcus neoformans]|nr:hypothetical protein C367_06333 [Cryptococcus neoformans var. grubii Ze90-1]OXH22587.1 hypothetical protein J008_06369 [Cryptococcus neoformans var. grubii]
MICYILSYIPYAHESTSFRIDQQRIMDHRPTQPILCFPPRGVPLEDIYAYTIPIPPEYSSGQVTKEYQDWQDSKWIYAANLSKHGDPTRTVVIRPRRSTFGHGDHLSVVVGPLVKYVPQTWPRKMFQYERFMHYPSYASKDPRAREAQICTWIDKLRAKREQKDARGRPLIWVQIMRQNDGVMMRWRNRLGVGKKREEKSHRHVSRKTDDTSPRPKPNLPSPAASLDTRESVKVGSHISPSSSLSLFSSARTMPFSPCPTSVHSSSSKISLQPPSMSTGILSPSLTPSSSPSPSPLLARPLLPSISGPPSPPIPATIPSPIPTPSPPQPPPPSDHSFTFTKSFTTRSPTISPEMYQQLTELLAKKEEQLTQWEKLKEEFHNDYHMVMAFDNQIVRLSKEIEEIKQLQRQM